MIEHINHTLDHGWLTLFSSSSPLAESNIDVIKLNCGAMLWLCFPASFTVLGSSQLNKGCLFGSSAPPLTTRHVSSLHNVSRELKLSTERSID
jgi:hypothetical protein